MSTLVLLTDESQELQVTPQSVLAAQQRFNNSMFSHLSQHHSRALASWGVGPEELQAVGQLLQSEPVLKLGLTLLHYLYTRWARNCLPAGVSMLLQAAPRVEHSYISFCTNLLNILFALFLLHLQMFH
jgi:hypothetical protein